MTEVQWLDLTRLMDGIQASHFPQAGGQIELHASPLRAGRGDFRGLPKAARYAAMEAVFGRIGEPQNGLTLFSVVVDKQAFRAQYAGVDPYEAAFENLCTMFNYFLRRLETKRGRPERGIIVMDQGTPAISNQMRVLLARFQAAGTKWAQLTHVIETPFFFDSKDSRLMQIVDFASYAVFRWYEAGDDTYISQIDHKFDNEVHKKHGLKCYPMASTRPYPPAKTPVVAVTGTAPTV